METPVLVRVEQVSEGWLNKYILHYELPGGKPFTYETISRKGYDDFTEGLGLVHGEGTAPEASTPAARRVDAVCIVGHTPQDEFLLIREFRFPLNDWCMAFPAGLIDPDEDVLECASRELREETGFDFVRDEAGAPVFAYCCTQGGYSSMGMSDESIGMVFAEVERVAEPQTEDSEFIEVVTLPRAEVAHFLVTNTAPLSIRAQLVLEMLATKPFTQAKFDNALNEHSRGLGAQGSAIRELFSYGLARKAEIGADAVFDFSLGNPSVAAPDEVREAVLDLIEEDPAVLHGYTPAQGDPKVREAIAASLNRRFNENYCAQDLYMTVGAAASINISLHATCNPGDEVVVITPYFPEYRMWIEAADCTCVECPADSTTFQVDPAALAAAITPRTKAVIINSPNNPVGVVYDRATLEAVADVLRAAEARIGHAIYLIADEPYRELVFGGAEVAWIPALYHNTLVCYSWSKSLSLPGERIGYVLVPPAVDRSRDIYAAVCGAGRALGFVCAPALFQKVAARCVDVPANIAAYARNRDALCEGLSHLGYEYVEPQGAFYLWVKALEPDAQKFSDAAKAHELLLVPSNSFGVTGWVRIGYCVSEETIKNSMAAFAALKQEYDQRG